MHTWPLAVMGLVNSFPTKLQSNKQFFKSHHCFLCFSSALNGFFPPCPSVPGPHSPRSQGPKLLACGCIFLQLFSHEKQSRHGLVLCPGGDPSQQPRQRAGTSQIFLLSEPGFIGCSPDRTQAQPGTRTLGGCRGDRVITGPLTFV